VKGRFITLEGGEGVGKSTQARRLAEARRAAGREVAVTREDRWTPAAEALLFAAARADHVAKTIQPALTAGTWVICDRFLDSSIAYQGGAGALGAATIRALHQIGSGGFLPDRTLLLELPAQDAAGRAQSRDAGQADRIGARNEAYHAGVATAFAKIAAEEPARFRRIDASGSAEAVTTRLLAELEDLL
jgi:dTMP kinase